MKRILLSLLLAAPLLGAEPTTTPLTLDDAVALAVKQSKGAQLSQLKIEEANAGTDAARRLRYPQIALTGGGAYLIDPFEVKISRGSLTSQLQETGTQLGYSQLASSIGQFPASDLSLAKGSRIPVVGDLTITQPLSQLWRIDSGVRVAKAGQDEARREAARTTAQIRYAVEELFVGCLLEKLRIVENEARLAFQERRLRDAENALHVGELLDESVLGSRATVIQAKADLTRSRQQYARLSLQLGDLIGRSGNDNLQLAGELPPRAEHPLAFWEAQAKNNPDRQIAAATVEKAAAAVRAARQSHIPDLSLFASGLAQDGIPLVSRRSGSFGLILNWDVFDFGRKDAAIAQAVARRRSAEVNRDRLDEDAMREIRLAHQDLLYAGELVSLASQALDYRKRAAQLSHQSLTNGLVLESSALDSDAELRKAEADLAGARYQHHLALLRLNFLAGEL